MSHRYAIAVFLAVQCAPAFATPIVEIKRIVGKPEAETSKVLGPSAKCEAIKQGKRCTYRNGQVEVVFIGGKADWMTINGLSQTKFSPSALTAIGLEEREPTVRTPFLMRWEPTQGFKSVSIFKGSTGVDYAYIKSKTQ
ncbi:hypothetical protein [Massilia haematophila]|uniref:Uncharacterized protein n=1 Tax=Massilia haematophila TaxID=457923 RepID=A0ABV7PLE3_9BURK